MRNKLLVKLFIFLFVFQSTALFGGATISQEGVQARSDGTNVIISWSAIEEVNLRHYVVQRRTFNGDFMDIEIVEQNSSRYYEYIDEAAYKTSDTIYIYRIKIVDNDDTTTYTPGVSVHHNVSSVKRTWGSIKALFR